MAFFYFSVSLLVFKKEVIENKMISYYKNLHSAQKSEPQSPQPHTVSLARVSVESQILAPFRNLLMGVP